MDKEELDISPVQAYILLLAGAKDREPIKGKKWLQAQMYFLAKNTKLGEVLLDYEERGNGNGWYSETVDVELENLEILGFLKSDDKNIQLSEKGRDVVEMIVRKTSENVLTKIEDVNR